MGFYVGFLVGISNDFSGTAAAYSLLDIFCTDKNKSNLTSVGIGTLFGAATLLTFIIIVFLLVVVGYINAANIISFVLLAIVIAGHVISCYWLTYLKKYYWIVC